MERKNTHNNNKWKIMRSFAVSHFKSHFPPWISNSLVLLLLILLLLSLCCSLFVWYSLCFFFFCSSRVSVTHKRFVASENSVFANVTCTKRDANDHIDLCHTMLTTNAISQPLDTTDLVYDRWQNMCQRAHDPLIFTSECITCILWTFYAFIDKLSHGNFIFSIISSLLSFQICQHL